MTYILLILLTLVSIQAYDWSSLDEIMAEGIGERAFPGGIVIVGNATHTIFEQSYGHFTYEKDVHEVAV